MSPRQIIGDGGDGGSGGAGVSLPQSGIVLDVPLELMAQDGLALTAYPEQRRIVLGPGFASQALGDLAYFDGTNWVRLPAGSAGNVLRSAGAVAPAWAFEPARLYAGSNQDFSGTSFADVTAVTFPILASATYGFRFVVFHQSTDATEGFNFSVNGPGSPTNVIYSVEYMTSVNAKAQQDKTAYDQTLGLTASSGATPKMTMIVGTVENGANAGNLALRCATETGAGGRVTTVLRGTMGLLWRVA